MGVGIRKRPGTKALPYFSHEFIIQNHGDIATCLCMVFVVGLMFQVTSPLATSFITPSYNVSDPTSTQSPILYTYGWKDILLVVFYTIAAVIFHAIVQEYILDKLLPKKSLSKTKEKKFNESGQLFAFYAVCTLWSLYIFREDGFFQSLNFLWNDYPHVGLSFHMKFFFIIQLSYWVHVLPELYFQKVKRDEMSDKIVFAAIHFFICISIYLLNLTRVGLVLLFIDYSVNQLFHLSRLFHFSGKSYVAKISFNIYNVLFLVARLAAIIISIFVFWFGLKSSSIEKIDLAEGNFNTQWVRIGSLGVILSLNAAMLWNYILFHCKKRRENSKPIVSSSKTATKQMKRRSTKEESDSNVDSDSNVETKKLN